MSSRTMCLIALISASVHADPAKPVATIGIFTAKSRLGVDPTPDQIRIGESANWRTAFYQCPQATHQPPIRVGDPRTTIAKEPRVPSGDLVDVTTLEMDFECGSCGGATCSSNQYCVEQTTLPGIDAPVTSVRCESLPYTRANRCEPAPGYNAGDQHVRCSPYHVSTPTCPKLGSSCIKDGETCGADAAAKASSFSNYMRCDQGTWQNVEVPPPAPPKH